MKRKKYDVIVGRRYTYCYLDPSIYATVINVEQDEHGETNVTFHWNDRGTHTLNIGDFVLELIDEPLDDLKQLIAEVE